MAGIGVSIGGDAGGAVAAVATAQGAIDSLHGKTVRVDIDVRQSGGGAGLGGVAEGLGRAAKAADDAGKATDRARANFDKASKSARGAGESFGKASEGAGKVADEAGRAAANIGRMDEVGQLARASIERMGVSSGKMNQALSSASGQMRELESGAGRVQGAMERIASRGGGGMLGSGGGSAIKSAIMDMHELADGSYGVAEAMKAIETSAGKALAVREAANRAGGGGSGGGGRRGGVNGGGTIDMHRLPDGSFGTSEADLGMREIEAAGLSSFSGKARAGSPPRAGKSGSSGGGLGPGDAGWTRSNMDMSADELADIRAARAEARNGGKSSGAGGRATPPRGSSVGYDDAQERMDAIGVEQASDTYANRKRKAKGGGSSSGGWGGGSASDLRDTGKAASEAAGGIDEMGKASSRASGPALNFNHAVRALREGSYVVGGLAGAIGGAIGGSESLAKKTAGVALNYEGLQKAVSGAMNEAAHGHDLGLSGFNSDIRKAALSAGNELAPAIKSSIGAEKELTKAGLGAWSSLSPEIKSFADTAKANMPAMQSMMTELGGAMLNMGTQAVQGVGASEPAIKSLANTINQHGGEIAGDVAGIIGGTAEALTAAGKVDSAVKSVVQPGGKPGLEALDKNVNEAMDHVTGARRNPDTGKVESVGHWGDYNGLTGAPKPGSPAAAGYGHDMSENLSDLKFDHGKGGGGGKGGFDPNKPFSGTAIGPDGDLQQGGGDTSAPSTSGGAGGGGRSRAESKHDADWSNGMTGKQIYESEFQRASGGYPSTGPMPSGLGSNQASAGHKMSATGAKAPDWQGPPPGTFSSTPGGMADQPGMSSGNGINRPSNMGFGSGVRPMPAAASAAMSGGIASLDNMTSSSMSKAAGDSGGGDAGQAMVKHVKKAVQEAAPEASAGGASLGGAMTGGMAQGITSTQTVTDTAIIKHVKKTMDIASGSSGIDAHSPSRKYDKLGRLIPQGLAQGIDADSYHTFGAMGRTLTGAQEMGDKFSADYDGSEGVTVSVKKPTDPNDPAKAQQPQQSSAMQYSPAIMAQIATHNQNAYQLMQGREDLQRNATGMTHDERAAQLGQGRADLHAKAMANLGVMNPQTGQRWQDPTKQDTNPVASMKAPSLWDSITKEGPVGDLTARFHELGQNSGKGLAAGLTVSAPKAAAAGATVAGAAQQGHQKKDDQHSPSVVWAQFGANSVAGLAGGIASATPQAMGAAVSMTESLQTAGQWLSDSGLMIGYTWAQNIATGAQQELKTADYKSLALPSGLGAAAMRGLAATNFLFAGSGASSYKTADNSSGVVGLGSGVAAQPDTSNQNGKTFVIEHQINIGGQISTIATQVTLDLLGNVADVTSLQSR